MRLLRNLSDVICRASQICRKLSDVVCITSQICSDPVDECEQSFGRVSAKGRSVPSSSGVIRGFRPIEALDRTICAMGAIGGQGSDTAQTSETQERLRGSEKDDAPPKTSVVALGASCVAIRLERRQPMLRRTPVTLAASCARTMPANELRSTTPSALTPSTAAAENNSSAEDTPRRNEKCVVTCKSA